MWGLKRLLLIATGIVSFHAMNFGITVPYAMPFLSENTATNVVRMVQQKRVVLRAYREKVKRRMSRLRTMLNSNVSAITKKYAMVSSKAKIGAFICMGFFGTAATSFYVLYLRPNRVYKFRTNKALRERYGTFRVKVMDEEYIRRVIKDGIFFEMIPNETGSASDNDSD